jgi:Domain of unknown function (DUF4279)
MTAMSGSAISTTSSQAGTLRTFASLRFRGDRLVPERVTEILGVAPILAYRQGEVFKRSRDHNARGRKGVWVLSSEGRVPSRDLDAHLRYLLAILYRDEDDRIDELRELMREQGLEADVGCFWYGEPGTSPPLIAAEIHAALARLPARIETDFHTN